MANPNATVQLLTVPWDRDYRDLRHFASADAQRSWYSSRGKQYTGMQAVRVGFPYTVKGNYNAISGYNYMAFNNAQYDNAKWFYAFIDRVEYRSEDSCDIYFSLDYWQTYLFDIKFTNSYIERHHTKGDTVPKTEEPVGAGDLAYKYKGSMWGTTPAYIVAVASTTEGTLPGLSKMGQTVAEGIFLYATERESVVTDLINSYKDKPEEIKAIYAVPSDALSFSGTPIDSYSLSGTLAIGKPSSIGNYVPRNKKCFYYPYCYAVVTNNQGSHQVFRFENCSGDTINFRAGGRLGTSPAFVCHAENMNNDNDNFDPVYLNGAPSVSYVSDYYEGYMQRHQMDIGTRVMGAAARAASIPFVAANPAAGAAGALSGIASGALSVANDVVQAEYQPNPTVVTGSALPLMFDQGKYNFSGYIVRCREDYIKRVDAFFDRFGYQVNNVGTPNPNNRSAYYFCKTNGATVRGSIPMECRSIMESALDRGVTFWHTDDIGNYNLANS